MQLRVIFGEISLMSEGADLIAKIKGDYVGFTLKNPALSTPKVDRAAAAIDPDQVINTGQVDYNWAGTDTDTPGAYNAEFEITPGSGGKFTLPNGGDGPWEIVITDSLDSV